MSIIVVAHHPYEATESDEISFNKDDRIKVTDKSDPDWWVGTLESTGASGLFPSNFVSIVSEEEVKEKEQPVETPSEVVEEEKKEEVEEKVPEKKDSIIGMARVMEDYPMQESGEISLHRGGIINVYEVIDNEWSRGELNGKVGRYPSKYVEDIDMPGRPDFGVQTSGSDSSVKKEEEGGFKLAAFGVKQGGIGSLFGGGFPGLKKTNSNPKSSEPTETKAPSIPSVPTANVPSVPTTTKPTEAPVVEEPKPVVEETKPEQPSTTTTTTTTESESAKKSLGKAIVLHPYDADNADELSLLRGEYVDILDREADDGWWEGKNERGETGVFPSNFVKELQEDVTAAPPPARRSINTPTSPTSQLPPVPNNNTRPSRPMTVQPTSNVRPIPSVPRPSSLNSPSPKPVSSPIARPPPVPEQNVLPVANVDQAVEEEPTVGIAAQPEVVNSPIEEPIVEKEPVVEEKEVSQAPVQPKEEVVAPVKEDISEKEEASPVASRSLDEPVVQPVVKEEEVVVDKPVVEEEKKVVEEPVAEEKVEAPSVEKKVEEPTPEEKGEEPSVEKKMEASPVEEKAEALPVQEEKKVEEPEVAKEEEASAVEEEKKVEEEEEEEKPGLEMQPTGPKLTTPSRARIGGNRARRTPITPSSEPSQTEILQKELEQMPEPEKKVEKPASPPPKPVKPIFAKFPTPFASGEEITKHHLKPVTRRPWEVKQEQEAPAPSNNEEEAPVRPTGVKNLASRFNFGGVPSSGGNEVLETKLKNHTKNEVEKVRKEFEALLNEEREKRNQLEDKVSALLERLEALENK